MKLKVSNFTRIKQAEIEIDGITVIAGHNNTGKSTIGKIFFSLFNSMYNLDEKIDKKRKDEIRDYNLFNLRNSIMHIGTQEGQLVQARYSNSFIIRLANKLTTIILNEADTNSDKIFEMVFAFLIENNIGEDRAQIEELANTISKLAISRIESPNIIIIQEIISRFFNEVFRNQINCLQKDNSEAVLELVIKEKSNTITFTDNRCTSFVPQYNILHEAFYIDNPFIIDEIDEFYRYDEYSINRHLISKIGNKDGIFEGLFDAVLAQEKLVEINEVLNKVIKGNIISKDDNFGMEIGYFKDPIKLGNLSTGLKSFVIIKMLLEKGVLKNKDVLILDEPEIHLHPEWQILYAEIIVLLQKSFDLSIIVTTHSSNFLEAIEFFSQKHCVTEKCKYYLAKSDGIFSIFEDVSNDVSKIYSQMVQPSILLDKLKYEMGNIENE